MAIAVCLSLGRHLLHLHHLLLCLCACQATLFFHFGYYAVVVYAAATCNNLFSSFPHLALGWKN